MIKKLGIIGSGKMGTDIFNYLSDFDFTLTWFILFEDEKEKLQVSFNKKIGRQLKHGLINREQYGFKSDFVLTNSLNDLSDCELVIESIPEEKEDKLLLFKNLQGVIKKDCIVVSNSSSIKPSLLSDYVPVAGLHFFYPIAFKGIVELIVHGRVNSEKMNDLELFLKSINKRAFIQNEQSAFLLNRFLLEIQIKALDLVNKYSISYFKFDELTKNMIPDFGLFDVMDQVGLNTMYTSVSNYADMEENKERFVPLLVELKSRIKNNSKFCADGDEEGISVNVWDNVLKMLLLSINDIYKEYQKKYDIDEIFFRDSLYEFCGIQL